jgi:hypothetical protein
MTNKQGKHTFTITVNNQPFETSAHQLTGAQVKSLAGHGLVAGDLGQLSGMK